MPAGCALSAAGHNFLTSSSSTRAAVTGLPHRRFESCWVHHVVTKTTFSLLNATLLCPVALPPKSSNVNTTLAAGTVPISSAGPTEEPGMHHWSTFSFVDCDRHRSEPDRNLDRFQGPIPSADGGGAGGEVWLELAVRRDRLPPLIGFGGLVRMGTDIATAFAPTSVHMRATRMGTCGVHKVSHRKPGSRRRSWLPRRAKTVIFVSIVLVQGTHRTPAGSGRGVQGRCCSVALG